MYLSEAIRKGSSLRPECNGDYFISGKKGADEPIRSDALGAAYEASTGKINNSLLEVTRFLRRTYPVLKHQSDPCECGYTNKQGTAVFTLESLIIHLQDEHSIGRSAIAGIVEEFEQHLTISVP